MPAQITIIDDDVDSRKLLHSFLRYNNFSVFTLANADEFQFERVQNADLFIIDLNLGGTSGDEICRRIKSHPALSSKPVIIVSADPEINIISQQACADDFLPKPFPLNLLLKKISQLLSR